jgi:transcriptional regulator with XRE-family HTH domain
MKSQKAFNNILSLIGATLAELRQKKGYPTIKAFALKYDLPKIQYWRIEKGKVNITLKSLVKILNIHKLSLPDFFCRIVNDHLVVP